MPNLQSLFSQSFDQSDFLTFCRGFLTDHFEEDEQEISLDNFNNTNLIKQATYLGEDKHLELSVFVVKHNSNRDPRVSLTREIQKIMKSFTLPNALVALYSLYSSDSKQWRLSLITTDINEKLGYDFSNPKRFSYVLGMEAKIMTPLRQLNIKVNTLDDLKEAFSLEVLTKEFYQKIEKIYQELYQNLVLPTQNNPDEKDIKDFALRLIGRLIFCWFLKVKGWIPKELFEIENTLKIPLLRGGTEGDGVFFKYYHSILEPIFFESLNKNLKDRNYNELVTSPENIAYLKQIPYLNGGLFEPKENDYYQNQPNYQLQVPDQNLQDILNLFETYHFTIDESTSTEQEIGVDPEMMGRIFENFILNRSQTGSFYTPREIVDYMVETSLKEILKTKNLPTNIIENLFNNKYWIPTEQFIKDYQVEITQILSSLKILDPACGSGAFPMGVLQKLSEIQYHLEPQKSMYEIKLKILQNSIYGVDILPIATEISRLRCWLSLVVDEDKNHPEPLPNLEFKFVTANSLVGVNKQLVFQNTPNKSGYTSDPLIGEAPKIPQDLYTDYDSLEQRLAQIQNIRSSAFKSGTDKQKLANEWVNITSQIYDLNLGKIKNKDTDGLEIQKITSWNPFKNKEADFFDPEWMFGETGFDLVIGNPPYVEVEKSNFYKNEFKDVLSGHYDLFIFFFKKAFDIAKKDGIVSYITPHTYLSYSQFKQLRKFIYENFNILICSNKIESIFENATVDNSIIVLSKDKTGDDKIKTKFIKCQAGNDKFTILKTIELEKRKYDYSTYEIEILENKNKLDKFYRNTTKLSDITDSSQGITVYSSKQGEKIDWFRTSLVDSNSKKVTRGREISKYTLNWSSRYIQYGKWLWCRRNETFFNNPKIFLRQTADSIIATYVEEPFYAVDSVHSIISNDKNYSLKFLLGILNSKVITHIYQMLTAESGKVFAQVKLTKLRTLPIPTLDTPEKQAIARKIEDLVEKILEVKNGSVGAGFIRPDAGFIRQNEEGSINASPTEYLENQIDELVFELYGLGEEEIGVVKG